MNVAQICHLQPFLSGRYFLQISIDLTIAWECRALSALLACSDQLKPKSSLSNCNFVIILIWYGIKIRCPGSYHTSSRHHLSLALMSESRDLSVSSACQTLINCKFKWDSAMCNRIHVLNRYESQSSLDFHYLWGNRSLMGRWMISSLNSSTIPYMLKFRMSIAFYKHFWALCSSPNMSISLLLATFGIMLVQNREYSHWFTCHWTAILAIWFAISIHYISKMPNLLGAA